MCAPHDRQKCSYSKASSFLSLEGVKQRENGGNGQQVGKWKVSQKGERCHELGSISLGFRSSERSRFLA